MKDLNSLELRKKLDAILNSAAGKDKAFIQANVQSVHSVPAKKIDSPLLDKATVVENISISAAPVRKMQEGGKSKLQRMLGSSISKYDKYSNVLEDLFNEQDYSVPSFQDSGEVNAQTPVTTPQQDGGPKKPSKRIFFAFAPDGDDTFIKESEQAAKISMATEGVPAEIVVLKNKQDFLEKVPEILRQNKDTEFGIFTHAKSFFKVPKKQVNQIISENMDEGCKLGLYSCYGMSQASTIFPDVKNIVHNIGTPWTGVPRFRTKAQYDALKGKPFAQVMYSIDPDGKYRPNVKEGIDYVDTTSFKSEEERKKFYEDAIIRQAEEIALLGLRYEARLENRTLPTRLPRNFNLAPYISSIRSQMGEQMADQVGLQSGMSTRLADINPEDFTENQNSFPSRERWHIERNIPITDESNIQYEEERYEFTQMGRPYVRPQPNEPVLIQPIPTRPLPVLRSNITRAKQGGIAHFQNSGKTTTSNYSWSTPSTYGSDNQVKPASKSQYATTYTEDTEAMRIQKSINDAAAQIINKNPKDFTEQDAAIIEKATNISDKNKYLDPYRIAVSDRAKQRGEFSDTKTFAESTGALGPKMSLQQLPIIGEYIPEALDVTRGIGEMASGLGRVPYNIQEGNYGQAAFAVALPLAVGALGGLGTRSTGQFVNNLVNPLAGTGELLTTKTPLRNLYKINPFANKNPLYSNLPSEGELIRVPFRETTSKIENISNNIDYFQAGDGLPYPAARGSETWQQLRNDPRFKIIKTDTTPSAVVDFPVSFGEDLTDPQKLPIPLSRLNEYRFSENISGRPNWLRGYEPLDTEDLILNRQQGGGVQEGGTVSRLQQMLGYKDNSPFKNLPYQDIYSDRITMQGVSRPLFARTDTGVSTIMQPGKEYYFPGASKVREIPIYQNSGKTVKKANAKEELKQITTEGLIPFVNISQEEKDALSLIASDYNISYRDLNTLLNKMAFQETGGTMSPTLEQKLDEGVRFNSNEHGVGLFQYNVPSAETSAKRAINYLNSKSLPIPSWIIDLRDNPQNISKLPASRQKILAAYDIAVKPNFSIRNALFGDESLSKEWGRGWQTKSEPVKMRQFVTNASKYADLAPLYPKEQLSFMDVLSGKKQPLDFNILRIK